MVLVSLNDPTDVSEARRRGAHLGEELGFDDTTGGRAAIVITEAATNVIRHGDGGEIYIGRALGGRSQGLQIIAMDRGTGMRDVSASLRDGFSTAGTAGNGLGAIQRVANTFDIHSAPGRGTVLAASIYANGDTPLPLGGLSVPLPGEVHCGDAWASWSAGELTSIFLVDGLGHGLEAERAARAAIEAFERHAERSTADVLESVHNAMRSTRGGAVAIAELDRRKGQLKYSGIGNISGLVVSPSGTVQHLVSLPGIAGHTFRRLQEFVYPWPPGSVLIMHSDGITTHWTLPPALRTRRADVIAGTVYRDYRRGNDDATVVAVRNDVSL